MKYIFLSLQHWPRKQNFRKPGKNQSSYPFATQHVWDKVLEAGSQNLKASFSPFVVDQHRVMRKFWTLEAFTELPRCASSFIFCTFFSFLTEGKFDWTCLHFALFSPFHFSFHWTSSLCIQPRIKGSVCKPWIWLREKLGGFVYTLHFFLEKSWLDVFTFCTFLREKLIGHAFCTFSMLIGRVYILHFFNVDWTCLHFAFFWERKLMGQSYILREKLIGQT